MLLVCPICAGEFEVQAALCPGCGVRLVPESIEQPSGCEVIPRGRGIDFEELCRPRDYSIAMLIKETLEQNGVAVIVQGGHSMSVLPSLSFLGELRVLVDKDQIEFARELYKAYFEGEPTDYHFEDEFLG